jgi:hypothetical protein
MAAIRIRKTIDSETLTLPELKPFIGQKVEIVIEEPFPAEEAKKEFWGLLSREAKTEDDYEEMHETLRKWRQEPRFQPYWRTIDQALECAYEDYRKKIAVLAQAWGLKDYDYQAQIDQDACDVWDQEERFR